MYIRCAKCGDTLHLYGEGIADNCSCPKKPIGIYLEDSEVKFFGPNKKIQLFEENREEYTTTPFKYYAVEVYRTVKINIITQATSEDQAADYVDNILEQDIIDFTDASVITDNIGNIVEIDYESVVKGDEEDNE